ncbi:hypothetical protein EDEG_01094 [Edhazardia aedis USNM 41457]|uniref:Uncharacterized protein n=1 Tax=Edhazardia aedis (strain USNM 41457) TaxID=1003232 RepID=J8ZYH5_EDHAE|nr:hypothetical protein EDEG_01094 [Edhazardia aedis USNM 41457]|eukprot:EJW04708.1 hypothetical protein EDEG_01094 [Edhazardia aedis USNM 41457]
MRIFIAIITVINGFQCASFHAIHTPSISNFKKYYKITTYEAESQTQNSEHTVTTYEEKLLKRFTNSTNATNLEISWVEKTQTHLFEDKSDKFILLAKIFREGVRIENHDLHRTLIVDIFDSKDRIFLNIIRSPATTLITIQGWVGFIRWRDNMVKVCIPKYKFIYEKAGFKDINALQVRCKIIENDFIVYYEKNILYEIIISKDKLYEFFYDDEKLSISMFLVQGEVRCKLHTITIRFVSQTITVVTENVNCVILNDSYPYKTIINNLILVERL